MEADVGRLVDKVKAKVEALPSGQKYMIGIAGIPGSGKTTLGKLIVSRINALLSPSTPTSPTGVFVGMDGFHLTRAQLSAMADPDEAHRRRGAAFTFDAPGFVDLVERIRNSPVPPASSAPDPAVAAILAPSFDHAIKDPVADDVSIPATARLVVLEGNYLALAAQPWRRAGELMDEIWFVEVEEATARKRLARRHVRAGIVQTLAEGERRADENDLPNGREIVAGRWRLDEVVVSREDEAWKEA